MTFSLRSRDRTVSRDMVAFRYSVRITVTVRVGVDG